MIDRGSSPEHGRGVGQGSSPEQGNGIGQGLSLIHIFLAALSPEYINGLTLLGGEPFEPENQRVLAGLLRQVKEKYPQKDIWCYTG